MPATRPSDSCKRFHKRRQAVGRAGRIRNHGHVAAQHAVIDAIDDGRIDAVRRRRDHDLLGATREVLRRLLLAGEEPRAFQHDFHAELAPGKLRRIAFGQHADAVAIDDHVIAIDGDLAREWAVRRVMTRQVRIGLRIAEVVDRDDLDLAVALRFVQRAQYIAADAAITIDTHLDRHGQLSPVVSIESTVLTTASAVKPKCRNRSLPWPEAPKPVMPMTRPREPT